MNKQLVPILFSFILLVSCGRTNMLSKEDYSWMPYTGDETLVFRANTGELDTIYLLKKDTMLAYPEAQSISGIKYEVVAVFCNHYGRNKQNPGGSYYLLQVQKGKDNHAEMVFHLSVDSAELYRLSPIKIDSLRKENPITFQTSGKEYDDVMLSIQMIMQKIFTIGTIMLQNYIGVNPMASFDLIERIVFIGS